MPTGFLTTSHSVRIFILLRHLILGLTDEIDLGVMHDMVGVNPNNQLMASNGQPTDLGYDYLS
jgi:hypothetical protein